MDETTNNTPPDSPQETPSPQSQPNTPPTTPPDSSSPQSPPITRNQNRVYSHNMLMRALNNYITNSEVESEEQRQLEMAIQESLQTQAAYKTTISEKGLREIEEMRYNPEHHQNDRCPITMEELEDWEGDVAVLPCKHVFFPEPLYEWLREKPECPICRHKMDSVEEKIIPQQQPQQQQPEPEETSPTHQDITNFPTNSTLLNALLAINVEEEIQNSRNTFLRNINNINRQ